MDINAVLNKLGKVRKGAIYDIGYDTNCSVSADNKKQGIAVFKSTTTTVRLGGKYEKMALTQQYKKEHTGTQPKQLAEKTWHIKDILFTNKSSGNTLLRVGRLLSAKPETKYYMTQNGNTQEITRDKAVELCVASEFNKKGGTPNPVWDINITHITSLMRNK